MSILFYCCVILFDIVLSEALQRSHGILLEDSSNPALLPLLQDSVINEQEGFIFNLSHHWFAIRKLNSSWY